MPLNLIPWQKVWLCWENLVQQGKDLKFKTCDAEKLVKFLKYVKFIGLKITHGLQVIVLFQHRTLRRQRVGFRLVNSKIFDLWMSYNDCDMGFSTMDLLLKLSKVHCAKFSLKKNVDDQRVEPDDCNFDN